MLLDASVKRILRAQEMNSFLTLDLTVNGKAITNKHRIPNAGESFYFADCLVFRSPSFLSSLPKAGGAYFERPFREV